MHNKPLILLNPELRYNSAPDTRGNKFYAPYCTPLSMLYPYPMFYSPTLQISSGAGRPSKNIHTKRTPVKRKSKQISQKFAYLALPASLFANTFQSIYIEHYSSRISTGFILSTFHHLHVLDFYSNRLLPN